MLSQAAERSDSRTRMRARRVFRERACPRLGRRPNLSSGGDWEAFSSTPSALISRNHTGGASRDAAPLPTEPDATGISASTAPVSPIWRRRRSPPRARRRELCRYSPRRDAPPVRSRPKKSGSTNFPRASAPASACACSSTAAGAFTARARWSRAIAAAASAPSPSPRRRADPRRARAARGDRAA